MSVKKTLIEVSHDEGYGDALLMHINNSFGGKDMRAERIVQQSSASLQVEGIPEGWELVRIGRAEKGEYFVNADGQPNEWVHGMITCSANRVIIREIEKPKRYRPFANGAEFLAHPLSSDWIDLGADDFAKVSRCNDSGIWFSYDHDIQHYEDAFVDLCFRDGTPFGVEVTE